MNIPNLRSCHDTVGGLVYFGRMLDKIRLMQANKLPEDFQANLGKGFDQRCLSFLNISYEELIKKVQSGATDEDVLAWVLQIGRQPSEEETEIWNDFMQKRGWNDAAAPILKRRLLEGGFENRTDIETMFDYIDLDEGRDPALKK
ncbi:MAG: DUF5069 domain-containing protein [Blastochloris sp.]|nr:DUF5069 domain-containing protein [Blastochloris sp.]